MKTIKLGIFGMGRGSTFFQIVKENGGEVVAICDSYVPSMERACESLDPKPACYTEFDKFIEHDMDAVFLANCFHEHAPFAIRALEKGLNVITECTSNATMAEGVALVRAAEKAKGIFMIAENYPYMLFNQEMRRVYQGGTLGEVAYAEGEYNHPICWDVSDVNLALRPYAEHWRNYLPATYYITHSLAPLMYITGASPKRVCALPVFKPVSEFQYDPSMVGDRSAIITTVNDDDSVFRLTGWSQYGAEENSFRICGTKGQIENIRGMEPKVMLRYNHWSFPEDVGMKKCYEPEWPEELKPFAEKAGHGGGDFFVFREFFNCIREGKRPEFDVYFATTMASVAILGHRSLLEYGAPYDIPDFRREEDRAKWENDTLSPFPGRDGSAPTIPCCSHPDYKPDEESFNNFVRMVEDSKKD